MPQRSSHQLLKKFAVCDIPLFDVCDYNVSRDQCKKRGCCFSKEVCYEKAVPAYVKGFTALIIIILGVFIIFVIYRVVQDRNKKTTQKLYGSPQKKSKLRPERTGVNSEIPDDEVILTVPVQEEELE
ncbi:testis-expressed protein 29 isoform X2 [Notamacropus eugenii]|uniref:testis-expressed protein 29 isoform X2 n=1 Tax=Notamacropus eugenii TaxID=9315 RepID=UPI003B679DD2